MSDAKAATQDQATTATDVSRRARLWRVFRAFSSGLRLVSDQVSHFCGTPGLSAFVTRKRGSCDINSPGRTSDSGRGSGRRGRCSSLEAASKFYVEVEKRVRAGQTIRSPPERAKEIFNLRSLPLFRFGTCAL
jgi:hypothetical protein